MTQFNTSKIGHCGTVLSSFQREKKLLAVCEITGLAITIGAPACSLAMEYKNPLAEIKNILSLIEGKALHSLENEILAGILLALLKRSNLIEGKLSSVEQNAILQTASRKTLIDSIELLARISKNKALICPRLSLDSHILIEDKTFENVLVSKLLINFLSIIKERLFGEIYLDSSRTSALTFTSFTSPKTKKGGTALTPEVKAELRNRIEALKEENTVSDKILSLLKISLTGDNLLSLLADGGIGDKIIEKLKLYDSAASISVVEALIAIKKNLTAKDTAQQYFTKDFSSVSDASISKSRKTLAEILAEKKASKVSTEIKEIKEEKQEDNKEGNDNEF